MMNITLKFMSKPVEMPEFQAIIVKLFAPVAQDKLITNANISANTGNNTSFVGTYIVE